jgi:phospholipase C
MKALLRGFSATVTALLVGCAGSLTSVGGGMPSLQQQVRKPTQLGIIQHVVIIVQENRTVDDLFRGLKGADTARSGENSKGESVPLESTSLTAPFDMIHTHDSFKIEYANGRLNGFNKARSQCSPAGKYLCPPADVRAYAYVPRSEVEPYFTMAKTYTFADRMFQTNEGPSFPAHQYIISGTSAIGNGSPLRASENPTGPGGVFHRGGCDSQPLTFVVAIDPAGQEGSPSFPCFNRLSLMDEINENSMLSWRYYQSYLGPGLWNAPAAVEPTYNSPQFKTDVVAPPAQFLTDVAAGRLASVTWITPTAKASDHGGVTDGSGPSWVASVVNAIGESKYWGSTAIFVTWDDWGGWYDHVAPTMYNSYELGFRVPLIVISPYAKVHYVSHAQHEFGSILHFAEKTFDLPSMGTTDARADDLSDCFDFKQSPTPFRAIAAPLGPGYFVSRSRSSEIPDDD